MIYFLGLIVFLLGMLVDRIVWVNEKKRKLEQFSKILESSIKSMLKDGRKTVPSASKYVKKGRNVLTPEERKRRKKLYARLYYAKLQKAKRAAAEAELQTGLEQERDY